MDKSINLCSCLKNRCMKQQKSDEEEKIDEGIV